MGSTLAGFLAALMIGAAGLATVAAAGAQLEAADSLDSVSVSIHPDPSGAMVGEVVNAGSTAVRDVRILIRHAWLWKNEYAPGAPADNPGRSAYYVVQGEVPAGGRLPFRYLPEPALPQRTDGSFRTTASVVGMTTLPSTE